VAAFVTALGVLWLVAAFTPLAGFLATGLIRRDSPSRADAVFVAASSIQQNGELTVTSMSRLVHGIELVAGHQAPALVLSDLTAPYPSYSDAANRLLDHFGVTTELLAINGPNENTHDEAVSLARTCRDRGWKRVIVVTSPYHSLRACAAIEHEGLSVVCSPSAETRYDVRDVYRSDERRRAFSNALHERIGLLVYRWRGWIAADTAAKQQHVQNNRCRYNETQKTAVAQCLMPLHHKHRRRRHSVPDLATYDSIGSCRWHDTRPQLLWASIANQFFLSAHIRHTPRLSTWSIRR
jgi:uncharacterized SAM-binding protein YcdF (DUF218 family)